MKRINYKSDFNFILRLLDCRGDEVGFPDYDWVARFWTGVKANAYEVSCIGGVCKNCYNDDGTIHVVVDNHHLSPGVLRVEFVAMLPDGIYPDGDERVAVPAPLDVELVRTAAPCPSSFEVEVILPYIKFRYEDLTDEQKAELMQPAVDAANHAEAVLKDAEAATAEAVRSNRELAANVEAAAEAETQRQRAEEARVSNEESRQRAETLREDAEAKRKAAETARVDTEAVRVTSENARVAAETERAKAETARVTAENARVSAEYKRVEQEDSRKEAEELRTTEETKRVDAEAKRVTAENARKTAEQGRVTAENGRVSAEEARVSAERERATEFESWQTELDSKADRTELTEGLATKQGNLSTTTDLQLTNDNVLGLSKEFKDSKLDKLVWDEKNEQFSIHGKYIHVETGYIYSDNNYAITPLIAINHDYDIIAAANATSNNASAISLYDQTGKFLMGVNKRLPTNIPGVEFELKNVSNIQFECFRLPAQSIPENAVYFRCGSRVMPNVYYSNGSTFESREGAFSEAIAASKLALFIDLWNSACGTFGKYDPQNAPDPEHPFYLNELWLTYEEAVRVYLLTQITSNNCDYKLFGDRINVRTNLPIQTSKNGNGLNSNSTAYFCVNNKHIEVLNMSVAWCSHATSANDFERFCVISNNLTIFNCAKLRKIIGRISIYKLTKGNVNVINNNPELEDILIYNLNGTINLLLDGCPKLNLASFKFIVQERWGADSGTATVTVHPDIYAKLTGDTTNAAAAELTQEELAQWAQVLVDASEKNIIFATT